MKQTTLESYLEKIEDSICAVSGVTLAEIFSEERLTAEVADARAGIWFIAYHILGMTYRDIAHRYSRDHSTVLSGVKRAEKTTLGTRAIAVVKKIHPRLFNSNKALRDRYSTADKWKV